MKVTQLSIMARGKLPSFIPAVNSSDMPWVSAKVISGVGVNTMARLQTLCNQSKTGFERHLEDTATAPNIDQNLNEKHATPQLKTGQELDI